ncbi:MAG: DUF1501 domain-containing protein, partial [Planctomycetales bacterium]|nr:DUF1501 domain-containing protein [Planctomycetales bacterium]
MNANVGYHRREILRAGLTGFASLSLGNLLKARSCAQLAENARRDDSSPAVRLKSSRRTAIILVWLRGGASHLETFDPKPQAPVEFRGIYRSIPTNVPGIHVSELLPRLSAMADRYALVRSLSHTGGGHPAGSLQVLGGDPDAADKPGPVFPDWMSVVSALRAHQAGDIPNYVAVNPVDNYDNFVIAGPTHLGTRCDPFKVVGDVSLPDFQVPNISLDPRAAARLPARRTLKQNLDRLQRQVDNTMEFEAVDSFEAKAIQLLTSPTARAAFDLSLEPTQVRERYGLNQWGQQLLMARRLVEAGV